MEAGWAEYRGDRMAAAGDRFGTAVRLCPSHIGARTGLAYVQLREGDLDAAKTGFERVLRDDPEVVDAWLGLGLIAWRRDEPEEARRAFAAARRLDPDNEDALRFLARLPEEAREPPQRPPLVRPGRVMYPARAIDGRFEVRDGTGWRPFYVKGVNIGAALPGRYASQFPDSLTYVGWLERISEMGANTVRVYTMHPPHFYGALRSHNLARPDAPLWLIHGVWAELPPEDFRYDDPEWEGRFFQDMRHVVDIVHGRADLPARPGHAHGSYTADVSRWTLGYILGREWESHSVALYNGSAPGWTEYEGKYLRLNGGTPADVWMARAAEEMIRHEMDTYRWQRPVAYTNWPTTDPLHHPTEPGIMEEASIRRALGDDIRLKPVLEGDDVVTLDPSLITPTSEYPAGYFASYHVYPYYPDFMVLSGEYNEAVGPFGPSNYWGYLTALKRHHAELPVLISEYGVPMSIGMAHLQPQGWHHGGNTEEAAAEIYARMTREIAAAGMAGGIVFEWIDEWFKKTWNTSRFEVPRDRDRLWYNRMDAEEHYGILAMEPEPRLGEGGLAERLRNWPRTGALYSSPDGALVRAAADEAYLWLLFQPATPGGSDELVFGLDVLDAGAGDFHLPGKVGGRQPVGLEFALEISSGQARLLVDPSYRAVEVFPHAGGLRGEPLPDYPGIARQPPGFFRGRWSTRVSAPIVPIANEDGVYDPVLTLTSRSRWGRDTTEYGAMGYEWGILPAGPLPDGLWERDASTGAVEVRIPWQLLNVADPSSKLVLRDPLPWDDEVRELATARIESVGVVLAARGTGEEWRTWPRPEEPVARFSWQGWDEPRWRARVRPVYAALRRAWTETEVSTGN